MKCLQFHANYFLKIIDNLMVNFFLLFWGYLKAGFIYFFLL